MTHRFEFLKHRWPKDCLATEMRHVLTRKEGSQKTRRARQYALANFEGFLRKYQLKAAVQVRAMHLCAYSNELLEDGLSIGSAQNVFSHIRFFLRKTGRADLARHPHTSNEALGIAGRSRIGAHDPIERDQMCAFATLAATESEGVSLMIRLAYALGLRVEEALMCGQSLAPWRKALASGSTTLVVCHGTKGGRVRTVPVLRDELNAVIALLGEAAEHLRTNHGFLIEGTLEQARNRFYYAAEKISLVGRRSAHSLRYGYADRLIRELVTRGSTEADALRLVANALGHSHGRNTWVKRVYCQHFLDQNKCLRGDVGSNNTSEKLHLMRLFPE